MGDNAHFFVLFCSFSLNVGFYGNLKVAEALNVCLQNVDPAIT